MCGRVPVFLVCLTLPTNPQAKDKTQLCMPTCLYMSLCSCFYTSVCPLLWSLSPASLEFAPKPLTKPWLGFDHFSSPHPALCHPLLLPFFTRIFLLSPHSSLCLHHHASFLFLPPCVITVFSLFFVPLTLPHMRERQICLGIKSAERWIPTHLVIAVSKPSDNSLNCLPSNLLRDWGGDGNLSEKKKKREMIMGVEKAVREVKNQGQKDMLAKDWKERVWVHICNI